ncbi:hypothetical protein [Halalkalicoccus subterraneus]|uniref:hypothetical protein n=1 Tax=Halalkalicoccus subterraneus TaxID=2675002 RepID=UPI000EFA4293|nr:hypothetical protein [Halalkalicoccus subterraneus]
MSANTDKTENGIDVTLDSYETATPEDVLDAIDIFGTDKEELDEALPCSCVEGDELPCWYCVLAGRKALPEENESGSEGEN